MRSRSLRFTPSFDLLSSRITPSGTSALISPMGAIMLGPDVPPQTDCLVSPMDAIMLGPDKEPTNLLPTPSVLPGTDISSPTSIVNPGTSPAQLAVNSNPPTCAPTALTPPVLRPTITVAPTLICPTLV